MAFLQNDIICQAEFAPPYQRLPPFVALIDDALLFIAVRRKHKNLPLYNPSLLHIASTLAFVAVSMRRLSGHGRVNPSAAHLRVASMPILLP